MSPADADLTPPARQFEILKRIQACKYDLADELKRTPAGERRIILQAAFNLTEAAFVALKPIIDLPDSQQP